MWKPEHRRRADRRGLRYDSDLTEAEWCLIAPLIRPAKRGGRQRSVDVREVLNASSTCCGPGASGRRCPRTCRREALSGRTWTCGNGTARWHGSTCALRRGSRAGGPGGEPDDRAHRQPDRQGCAQRGASLDPPGYDAGKKTVDRKRHVLTDTVGLLLVVTVHPADVQGRD